MNKNILLIGGLLVAIIVVGVLVATQYMPSDMTGKSLGSSSSPAISSSGPQGTLAEAEITLQAIAAQLKINSKSAAANQDWKTSENSYLPLTGKALRLINKDSSLLANNLNDASGITGYFDTEKGNYPITHFDSFFSQIDTVLTDLGFAPDKLNTDLPPEYSADSYRFLAKTNGALNCKASLRTNNGIVDATIFCGMPDSEQVAWREEVKAVYADLDSTKSYSVEILEGSAARTSVGGRYEEGGGFEILVKENGVWKKIYGGQDNPACTDIEQYKVPLTVYRNCLDDSGKLRSAF